MEPNIRTQIEPSADGSDPAVETVKPEVTPDAETTPDQTPDNPEPEQGGEGAGEPGEEGREAGEGGDVVEEETEQPSEVNQVLTAVEALHKRLDRIEKGEVGSEDVDAEAAKSVLIPDFTPEFFANIERDMQIPEESRGLFQAQAKLTRALVNQLGQKMLGHTANLTAGYRKDQVLSSMAAEKDAKGQPKYPGINSPAYKAAMDEFLKDYSPSLHSRREVQERAFWYAKGKNADKAVAQVRKTKEVGRTIAGKTRLSPTGGGGGVERKPIVLDAAQKAVAAKFGGEKSYLRDLEARGTRGAVRLERAV